MLAAGNAWYDRGRVPMSDCSSGQERSSETVDTGAGVGVVVKWYSSTTCDVLFFPFHTMRMVR